MRVECESSKLTPRPLFKGRMAGHRWERPGSTGSDRWKKLGPLAVGRRPADPRVRPETFRPMPFMMEQKHVQLETGYVSETELNVLTRELLLLSCSKEMRERGLLNSNHAQKSNENPRAKFERE